MTIPPSIPNFDGNTGRLATDRFDFEKHVNGTGFRHHADQIDLSPPIMIGSQSSSQVQDAIAKLAALVVSTVPDATTSSKGIIQLSGDISGTATNVVVTGINGKPLSNLSPSNGQALVWNGSSWAPATVNSFVASGDLAGNNISQTVISLTGASGTVNISANFLTFTAGTVFPVIGQASSASNLGGFDLTINAQAATVANAGGGNLVMSGGRAGAGGVNGGVKLQIGATPSNNLVQLASLSGSPTGRRILSLLKSTDLNTTDMPDDTGDMIVYLRDAAINPGFGAPSNGVIIYAAQNASLVSELHVRQSDGNDITIGSTPNPSIWGPDGYQVVTERGNPFVGEFITSIPGSATSVTNFSVPVSSAVKVDLIAVGKEQGTGESAQFNLSMGFVRNGTGAVANVGTLTSSDPRLTSGASSWTLPTITAVGFSIEVNSGFSPSTFINWLFSTQFTVVTA